MSSNNPPETPEPAASGTPDAPSESTTELPPAVETTDALLKFTYQELLDATKHQDDKINRLLSAIAFLTASSLALGNLNSAAGVKTRYLVAPGTVVPLALILLGAFLIGVIASVVMLINSLTTPLRFPGGTKAAMPKIEYADRTVEASPIYFTEIAGTSLQQWYAKWQKPAADIVRERRQALIRETHNLAVRTDFKYQQTKEAVAVLTFALLSLALSVVLVLGGITAQRVDAPIPLSTRLLLGLTLGGYVTLHLFATARERRQTVVERATFETGRLARVRQLARVLSPITVAAVPAVLVAMPFSATGLWAAVAIALPVVSWLVFITSLPWVAAEEQAASLAAQWRPLGDVTSLPPPVNDDAGRTAERNKANARLTNLRWIAAVIALAYLVIGVISAIQSYYWLQLLAGYGAGVILLLAALIQYTRARREQVRRWLRSTAVPPAASG